jgi:hypothetical protein
VDYCHVCSGKQEDRVDLLEMKTFGEIDIDSTPIIVLGCGHFFTAETLDGHVGIGEVFTADMLGDYTGLRDMSAMIAPSEPRCPDCQCPVRQYATRRYNRLINKAVIDEMSKRFILNGKAELHQLELKVDDLEQRLRNSELEIESTIRPPSATSSRISILLRGTDITDKMRTEQARSTTVEKAIISFCGKIADMHQPAQKLHDATVLANKAGCVEDLMAGLSLNRTITAVPRERQITLGGRTLQLKNEGLILRYKFQVTRTIKEADRNIFSKLLERNPEERIEQYFRNCKTLVDDCVAANLPKLAAETCLFYAETARLYKIYCRLTDAATSIASDYMETAKELLTTGSELCKHPFQNAKILQAAIEGSMTLFGKEWYEEVTANELASIKAAMVSGPSGIATHSGHWYSCENGHPVSLIP